MMVWFVTVAKGRKKGKTRNIFKCVIFKDQFRCRCVLVYKTCQCVYLFADVRNPYLNTPSINVFSNLQNKK